ncbi:hypothetical protein V6N12_074847 [Hibiscus sabdariffa]|uniref:Uncharacterized protein n=1 Tax=Hibiscus sabdariffa TaxID=183260 RepID=A0ABR2D4C4_9ROSI
MSGVASIVRTWNEDRSKGNPKDLQFGEWLRFDFRKPKHAGLRHPKQGIVLSKRDVADGETSSIVVCESGTLVSHPSQVMVVGGDRGTSASMEDNKSKSTKRTYV